jgi:hypothetical protein
MIMAINEEIGYHKKEVLNLRAEKESLENVLALKAHEVRKTLNNEASRYDKNISFILYRIEEELKRNLAQ